MWYNFAWYVSTLSKLARAPVSQQAGGPSKCWCWMLWNKAVPHTPPRPKGPGSRRANSPHYDDKVPWHLQSPKSTDRPHSSSAFCHRLDRCVLAGHKIGFELILPLKNTAKLFNTVDKCEQIYWQRNVCHRTLPGIFCTYECIKVSSPPPLLST